MICHWASPSLQSDQMNTSKVNVCSGVCSQQFKNMPHLISSGVLCCWPEGVKKASYKLNTVLEEEQFQNSILSPFCFLENIAHNYSRNYAGNICSIRATSRNSKYTVTAIRFWNESKKIQDGIGDSISYRFSLAVAVISLLPLSSITAVMRSIS